MKSSHVYRRVRFVRQLPKKKKSHSERFKAHRDQLFIIFNSFTHYRLSGIKQTRLVNLSSYLLKSHVVALASHTTSTRGARRQQIQIIFNGLLLYSINTFFRLLFRANNNIANSVGKT